MKKGLLSAVALLATVVGAATMTSCAPKNVINIRAWNDEFKRFFEKYVSDEKIDSMTTNEAGDTVENPNAPKTYHVDGVPVKWSIVPSQDAQYQDKLDIALEKQEKASEGEKVDMFLAEADYILKYADSATTQNIREIGVTDMSKTYNYTVQAASDRNGVVKGVSFQCCPSALIYNKVIAEDVFGTSDPAVIQEKLSDWDKFNEAAAAVKAKGYFMTASVEDSYRVFSNNATTPWVDANGNVSIPEAINGWKAQSKLFIEKEYTVNDGVWGDEKNKNIVKDKETGYKGKAFCCFGPAWYYNFCMGGATKGDWRICKGPQAHFWGGTWLMAATGSNNTDAVAKIMNAFINDETVCENLIKNDGQFTNNQTVNARVAAEYTASNKGNEFLGGQNDTAIFLDLAKNIKFENATNYDQICNEKFQQFYREYLGGSVTESKAIENFYKDVKTKYSHLIVPVAEEAK